MVVGILSGLQGGFCGGVSGRTPSIPTREYYNTDIQISNSKSQPIQIEVIFCILKCLIKGLSIIKIYHSDFNSFHAVSTGMYSLPTF